MFLICKINKIKKINKKKNKEEKRNRRDYLSLLRLILSNYSALKRRQIPSYARLSVETQIVVACNGSSSV